MVYVRCVFLMNSQQIEKFQKQWKPFEYLFHIPQIMLDLHQLINLVFILSIPIYFNFKVQKLSLKHQNLSNYTRNVETLTNPTWLVHV